MAEHQVRHPDNEKQFNPPGAPGKPFDIDKDLAERVKEALLRQTESAGIDVQVSAGDGTVRLFGVVDVLSHKHAAEQIAGRIPGVQRLVNDITVANEEGYTDHDLAEAVTDKLGKHDVYRGMGCRVHRGVVRLVGHAPTQEDVQGAIDLVAGMAGVREVEIDRVKVGEGRDDDDADVSRAADRMLVEMGYDHNQFQVYTVEGILHVKGFVHTREERSNLKTALHKIPGVDRLETILVTDDEFGGEVH
ncbi:MAG: BON domain-containing protein [Mycobacterium leprae]